MSKSMEELEEMDYRELQSLAKQRDLKANGSKEELIDKIVSGQDDDSDSEFKDLKENIEDELQGHAQKNVSAGSVSRVPTGVSGLDEVLNGGIPEKNLVLVSGGPGTGKTTLGLQFLIEGIKQGQNTVYVNMDERREKLVRNAKLFGWDIDRYTENESLVFVRPKIFDFKKAKREIDNLASRFDAERIVIDSFSVWSSSSKSEPKRRKRLMELNQRLERLDATTLNISEAKSEDESENRVEEFAVDGIIKLYYARRGSTFQRGITVRKMRGSGHSHDIHPLEIGKNGVKVYPNQEVFEEM